MTKGQSDAIRAMAFAFYSLCAMLEARGVVTGAEIAAQLRRHRTVDDDGLRESVEALATNIEANPFGPDGFRHDFGVIDGGKQDDA